MAISRTLIVTGLSSFIGVSLGRFFAQAGYRVIGTISRNGNEYDPLRKARLEAAEAAGVQVKALDIRETRAVHSFVESEQPLVWVHHAGWATDYGSLAYDLGSGHAVNVEPLKTLYDVLSNNGCRGILLTGSSMEYTDSDYPCKEEDSCWPTTPYGLSKLSQTIRARQLAYEYGLRTRVARIFIPYGPFDAPSKVIPTVVDALGSGKRIDLSPCHQVRDFIHVEDLVRGYGSLVEDLHREDLFDLFNLCSGGALRVCDVLLEIARIMHADPRLLLFGKRPMRTGETMISYGANAKALRVLGWQPRPLHNGLQSYLHSKELSATPRMIHAPDVP